MPIITLAFVVISLAIWHLINKKREHHYIPSNDYLLSKKEDTKKDPCLIETPKQGYDQWKKFHKPELSFKPHNKI